MATHVYKVCPYCRFPDESIQEGGPIRVCRKCKRPYLDQTVIEPALTELKIPNIGDYLKLSTLPAILFCIPVGYVLSAGFFGVETWGSVLGLGFGATFLIIFLILCLRHSLNTKNDERLWKESDERLKDPYYARFIAALGYKVPERYLAVEPEPNSPRYETFWDYGAVWTAENKKQQTTVQHPKTSEKQVSSLAEKQTDAAKKEGVESSNMKAQQLRYCKKCGKPLLSESIYCSSCGAKQ